MTKKVILAEGEEVDFDCSLADVLEKVERLARKYGLDGVSVEKQDYTVPYDDCRYTKHVVRYRRLETDEEYQVRVKQETSQQEAREVRERKEFERLSQKYGQTK